MPVAAQPKRAAPVLVLEVPNGGWKEGVQALVAELIASNYELTLRAARAHSLDELEAELEREVVGSGAMAGVLVTRADGRGFACLCRATSPCERFEMEIGDGELSRSRLALAVVERLRPIDLPARVPAPKPAQQAAPPVTHQPTKVHPLGEPSAPRFRAWVGGGSVLASGLTAPLPWAGASFDATLRSPWGLELGLAGSPLAGTSQSYAGSLSLRALQITAFATFEPFARRGFGLHLGLGGGTLYLRENATPAPGFDGFSRSASVAVVSARARLQYRAGSVYVGLVVDPGMLVPALNVEAGTATVQRIGRPWLTLQASLGLAL